MTPNQAAKKAQAIVREWVKATGGRESDVSVWNAKRIGEWVGEYPRPGTAALVYEDTMWSAVDWSWRLQKAIDPSYESVLIEPQNDYMLMFWDERG